MRKGIGILLSAVLFSSIILAGCATKKDGGEASKDTAVVKVGTDAAYPPFEKQEGTGEISGFDVDIMQAVAKAAGFKVEIRHTGWDPLFEGIDSGKVDAGISAITITEERKKKYDFSEPYFDAKQLILVPADSSVTSLKDLNGKKIGVQSATTGETVVQEAFGKTYPNLKGYDDTPAAIEDLKLGRVDAVVADNGVVLEYVKKLGKDKFKVVEDASFEPEYYGIIVKKGNKELLEKINAGLKKIREDGTYDKIYQKYFGQ
ncbi:basic amino acid ABC transporter substrate-binding protein [Lihuaxuella thermophila]|uniref:Polar amino acid transport system substrate-binding protein n=1 Tax=Lihuaxuella thermophila TaxID=1173111 RepID=A0A1H8B6Y3_9BACL|nr:basic amino acid ABC transporter substrate-binding protein [Lihuaxuella thermophila]SEM78513.1 polar amino acid transport system substrate-binding protein [Lihuaxuella thermophila]